MHYSIPKAASTGKYLVPLLSSFLSLFLFLLLTSVPSVFRSIPFSSRFLFLSLAFLFLVIRSRFPVHVRSLCVLPNTRHEPGRPDNLLAFSRLRGLPRRKRKDGKPGITQDKARRRRHAIPFIISTQRREEGTGWKKGTTTLGARPERRQRLTRPRQLG